MKYSVFTLILPQSSPAEAAALIKDAGYDGIEWRCAPQPDELPPVPNCWSANRTTLDSRHWRKPAAEYKRIMNDHGLEFSSLATYCRADETDAVKTAIEIARSLSCPRLRILAPKYDGKTRYQEVFAKARAAYEKAAELCRDARVQGLIELHMGGIASSASLAFRLLDGLDPASIAVIHDAGNMIVEGYENWKLGCELLGPYLAFCHAKNQYRRPAGITEAGGIRWGNEPSEMHAGQVDWLEVYRAFKAVGYDGWISNESCQTALGSTLKELQADLAHLRRCEAIARASTEKLS